MRDHSGTFWERYESSVDEQIRSATERGLFDDLPGAGKPLDLPARDDENWWVRDKMRAEGVSTDAFLPPAVRLRKELDALDETVADLTDEAAVREVVGDLDRRVAAFLRAPTGPRVPVRRPSVEAVLDRWRATRPAPDVTGGSGATAPETRRRRWWRRR